MCYFPMTHRWAYKTPNMGKGKESNQRFPFSLWLYDSDEAVAIFIGGPYMEDARLIMSRPERISFDGVYDKLDEDLEWYDCIIGENIVGDRDALPIKAKVHDPKDLGCAIENLKADKEKLKLVGGLGILAEGRKAFIYSASGGKRYSSGLAREIAQDKIHERTEEAEISEILTNLLRTEGRFFREGNPEEVIAHLEREMNTCPQSIREMYIGTVINRTDLSDDQRQRIDFLRRKYAPENPQN